MKKEINVLRLLLIAIGIIIVASLFIFFFANERVNYNELTEVRIKRMGTMVPSGNEYVLTLKNGTWVASYNEIEWLEDNVNEIVVDDAFANQIKELLEENKAHKWDDFNLKYEIAKKIESIATDGEYYGFYMHFSDGSITKVEEYNIYPENFMTVLTEFEKQYKMLFDE